MALRIAKLKRTILETDYQRIIAELELIPTKVEKVLEMNPEIEKITRRIFKTSLISYI